MSRVVALVAALQFIYIVDFMMVLPLGPDLAAALGFAADRVGMLTAAYTLASMAAGLACMRLLDRFRRKSVVLAGFGAMALATLATTLADSLPSLLLARALTGFAGAPAIAAGMALVIDSSPPERRGAAIARVMTGFALAAIAGVPLALELARAGGWRLPFMALAGAAALVWLCAAWMLPAGPALGRRRGAGLRALLGQAAVRRACALQALVQFSSFLLIPHVSAYLLLNLGFPRDRLGLLYVCGGVAALITVRVLGALADRSGPALAAGAASLALGAGVLLFFAGAAVPYPMLALLFVLFMAGNAGRNVSVSAALSQVPAPHQRAAFMALQSIVQDVSIAAAALAGAALLVQGADGRLAGAPLLACAALAVGCAVPWALRRLPTVSLPGQAC